MLTGIYKSIEVSPYGSTSEEAASCQLYLKPGVIFSADLDFF